MKKLAAYYFSGTGNTKYVTEKLCGLLAAKYEASVTEIGAATDPRGMARADSVLIAFPVYGGAPPIPVRKFAHAAAEYVRGKECIVVATQYMFSGDGAASLGRALEKAGGKVSYAEHICMPNNLSDCTFFKIRNGEENAPVLEKANKRIAKFARRILDGKPFRRGFNVFSHAVGYLSQRALFRKHEAEKTRLWAIDENLCIGCGVCVAHCPVQNLHRKEGKATSRGACVLCYRCVNACPRRAIRILGKKPPVVQYKGVR